MNRRQFLRRAGIVSAAGVAYGVTSRHRAEAATNVIFLDSFTVARSGGWGPHWYNQRYQMTAGVSNGAAFYTLPNPQFAALRHSPNPVLVLDHDVADADLVAQMTADKTSARFGLVARSTSYSDCYAAYVDGAYLKLSRFSLFSERVLAKVKLPTGSARNYWLRMHVSGANLVSLKAKLWRVGKPQPYRWKVQSQDSAASRIVDAGAFGAVFLHDAVVGWQTPTVRVSSFKASSPRTPAPSNPKITFAFAGRTVESAGTYKARVVAKTDIPASVAFHFAVGDPQLSTYRTVPADEKHAGPETAKGWLDGLAAGLPVYWRAEATSSSGRKSLSAVRKLPTPPLPGERVSFAFGSCTHITSTIRSLSTAADLNPMFFAHLGDFAYANAPQSSAAGVRADFFQDRWARALKTAAAEKLAQRAAWLMVQDDHDYGHNNCWSGTLRPFTLQAWDQVSGNLDKRYFDVRYGDCHCFFVDTHRWADDPQAPDGPNHSALGDTQKSWLKTAMSNSDAPLLIVFAPTPFKKLSSNYQNEVNELVSFLLNLQARGHRVLICGGNAHAQYVGDFGDNPNYFQRLLEFTSSGTERPGQKVAGAMIDSRVRAVEDVNAFGYVELSAAGSDRTVTARSISSENGTDVWRPLVLSVP